MAVSTGALAGLSQLAGRYDVILSDVWGVLHNGIEPYPGAAEALAAYRAAGGRVVLITNSPRPSPLIGEKLSGMAISSMAYDDIVSSGDVTRSMISRFSGRTIHYVGPGPIGAQLLEGIDVGLGRAEDADAVLVTDLDTDDDTPDMYEARMKVWRTRGLPLICANPDRVVELGDRLVYCGGALADRYAELGGEVLMAGKPYPQIYEAALRLAAQAAGRDVVTNRILAIGDSTRTDAAGAAATKLDLLFIISAIHAGELEAAPGGLAGAVAALVAPTGARLAGYMPRLVW